MRFALFSAARRALHQRRFCAAMLRLLPRLLAAACIAVNPLLHAAAPLPAAAGTLAAVCLLLPLLEALRCRWLCGRLTGCTLRLQRRQRLCVYGTAVCLFWLRAWLLLLTALPPAVLFLALRLRLRRGGACLLSLWIDGCGLAVLLLCALGGYLLALQRDAAALPLAVMRPGLTPRQAILLSRRRTADACPALLRARVQLQLRRRDADARFLLLLLTDYAADGIG